MPLMMQLKQINSKTLKLVVRTVLFSSQLWKEVLDDAMSDTDGINNDNPTDGDDKR
jgi:hypothetical protein